jgi:hypothetical protein
MAAFHVVIAGTAVAGPVGAAIAGAIVAIGLVAQLLIKEFSGCGQSCIIASNAANKFEPYLQQNLAGYLSSPIRYASMQAAALANFDTIFNALKQACSDPSLGTAGQRCISDRQAGGCQWKASPGSWNQVNGVWTWTGAGPSGSGNTCWNWVVGYRDPIANDPGVVPDPSPVSQAATGLLSSFGINPAATINGRPLSDLLLPAGLLLAAALFT